MITVKEATTVADIEFCFKALLAFRPMIIPENLIEQTHRMMVEGFRLAYIANDDNTEAAAIVGFRSYEMYRTGRIIYIDDVFTFPEYRGRGYAGALLDHIDGVARQIGAQSVHLDSGFALHPAHRLYLNKGFVLPCHHFAKDTISHK